MIGGRTTKQRRIGYLTVMERDGLQFGIFALDHPTLEATFNMIAKGEATYSVRNVQKVDVLRMHTGVSRWEAEKI